MGKDYKEVNKEKKRKKNIKFKKGKLLTFFKTDKKGSTSLKVKITLHYQMDPFLTR